MDVAALPESPGQHLAPPLPVHADRDQDSLTHDDTSLAHFLVARIENEIGIRLLQPSLARRAFSPASSVLLIWLIDEAENEWPTSSSIICLTFLVETPCAYISTKAFNNLGRGVAGILGFRHKTRSPVISGEDDQILGTAPLAFFKLSQWA
jgi:hypothetical protein